MKRLINFFITGQWKICDHHWEIIDSERMNTYSRESSSSSGLPVNVSVINTLQCKHCGELKYSKVDL